MSYFNNTYTSYKAEDDGQMLGTPDLQQDFTPQQSIQSASPDGASVASGAASGAAMGGPAGAAIGAGGAFLNSYLQAKAREAEQKKAMAMQAAKGHETGQTNALGNMMNAFRAALL